MYVSLYKIVKKKLIFVLRNLEGSRVDFICNLNGLHRNYFI